jgi:hypothetical protein
MQITSCPWCNNVLQHAVPTQVCSTCGKNVYPDMPKTPQSQELSEPDLALISNDPTHNPKRKTQSRPRRVLFTLPYFSLLRNGLPLHQHRWWGNQKSQKNNVERFAERITFSIPLTLDPRDEGQFTDELQDQASEENDISQLRPDGQVTWQKVVEPSPRRQSYTYPPRPPVPEGEHVGTRLALASVLQSSITLSTFKTAMSTKWRKTSPMLVFWASMAVLLVTVGLFSIVSTLGRGKPLTTLTDNHLSLQITPNKLSVGATMTLHGKHFSPQAAIGLTRDNATPLADTSGAVLTQADATGQFTDTIIVGDDWEAGTHVILAEDALKHQVASFPIMVDGKGISLRPPHLHVSVNTLDFGTGDQATNSTKALTLLNSGNGEIVWQESTSQPWLLMTPTQGNFTRDIPQQVTIAVDRSKLRSGSYTAQVNFTSNGGNESLAVSMKVTQLQPQHDSIMQISPTLLSFTATDGSNTTASQQIAVSNSGGQGMNWQASANVPWLNVASSSTLVAPGAFATAKVSVVTRNLLPGTYTGTLTFSAQNVIGKRNAFYSPQQVVVSITITPPCILQMASGMISFSSAYLQPSPSSKTINVTASNGCAAPLKWNATSNKSWLKLNNTHGTTPDTLSIGVNTTGLTPDTYTGTIILSSPAGTQTAIVTLILGPADSAAISAGPPSLSFNGIAGQAGPTPQTVQLSNTGGGILHWQASTILNLNTNWLLVTPASGTLSSHQTTTLTVTVMSSTLLASGNYHGTILLTGDNGAGRGATGSPQNIPISYIIKPACTLQAPSTTGLNFSTIAGINPTSQSFSIGVTGACSGGVTITPTLTAIDGGNWLSVSPSSATVTAGSSVTFTTSVSANTITVGQHSGTMILNGVGIAGSSQTITVAFAVAVPPLLAATPSTININISGSTTSSPINLTNQGGSPLNWVAMLQSGTPAFISLSATSGSNLAGNANTSFNLVVNANGVTNGVYQTSITISASSAANGLPVTGSPVIIPITITISSPLIQVNSTSLTLSGSTSNPINPQAITITNAGGGILSWTVSSPRKSWLSIDATAGSTVTGASSTLTFSVLTNGLSASTTDTDQVVITPSVGNPITINISLPLIDLTLTPTSSSTPTINPHVPATTTAVPSSTPTTFMNLPRFVFRRIFS